LRRKTFGAQERICFQEKNRKVFSKILVTLIAAFLLVGSGSIAHARKGKAAYHLHTSRMVTAARHEPRGSILKVTNPETGKSVTVTVNDRGPWNGNRILDLSTGAFKKLFGSLKRGVGPIRYEVIRRGYGKKK
jgi:rare lipoprotein A